MRININPFIYGPAVKPAEFLGRERELRTVFSRLANGQSVAIVGEPHTGKTSLLLYVIEETQSACEGKFDRDVFNLLDAQAMRDVKTQAAFWQWVLEPLGAALQDGNLQSLDDVKNNYAAAKKNDFGTFVLEKLFKSLGAAGSRLFVLLDEFDDFLSHEVLNKGEFYGGLRSLASRCGGLVLVLAVRRDVSQLNSLTQTYTTGSPFFNIFTDVRLSPLSHKAMKILLDKGIDRFTANDRNFVAGISGNHPYLAQAAAGLLWEAYDEECETNLERFVATGQRLRQQAESHFADTWRNWSHDTRKAVTMVALSQIPHLLPSHDFLVEALTKDLNSYRRELENLKNHGLLAENVEIGWMVTQGAFLWWLSDELLRTVRKDTDFEVWLRAQELDGVLTKDEREHLAQAWKSVSSALGKGATALIEAAAKGAAGAIFPAPPKAKD